jgi:peptidoglycan/LPS O-acetylase OafA/YrhL
LLAIPLAIIEGVLRPKWPGFQNLYSDWANFFLYFFYFIYGYIICADARFGEAIDKHLKIALIMAIASMSVLLQLWVSDIIPNRGYSLEYVLYQMFRGVNSWLWIVALLGLARRYLNFNNSVLQYATQASYPFYILHQTIVVAIAFYVVHWNIGITAKFLIISMPL